MKHLILSLFFFVAACCTAGSLSAQDCSDPAACNYNPDLMGGVSGVPCLFVETVVEHSEGTLAGLTTYRVYFQAGASTDFVTSVFGNESTPLTLTTTTQFYQNALGSASSQSQNPLLFDGFPDLVYDSYVTIGLTESADASAGESNPSLVASPGQDWAAVFDPGQGAAGGNIVVDDLVGGIWFIFNGDSNGFPDENNRVLLAQLTTDGELGGTLNIQYFQEGGDATTATLSIANACETVVEDCTYAEPNLDCDGNCLNDVDADQICDEVDDCIGELDALGVCGGGCAADADLDGICDDVDDCVGDFDACGVCNGPGAVFTCGCDEQPAEDCDCDGNQEDALGVCGGDCAADTDQDGICDDEDDCIGVVDECGICNGPGATSDCGCDDVPDGDCDCDGNELDALGDCGGDCTADSDQDGVCDDVDDCIGEIDACGICNGPGAIYTCGCDEQPAEDCDCDGNQLDALGICGGDCPADADANGICDDVEGSGCGDPDACNFDPFADPPVEEPITDYCMVTEAVVSHTTGALAGMTTYRVYIQTLNPTDFVTSVSGSSAAPIDISTTTTFYQDVLGGATPENVNPLLIPAFPSLAFDSWVTIGLDGPANATAGESAATIVNSPNQNWALQFEPGFGAPGGNIVINDQVGGVWYILNGDANGTPDTDGRVLLGQFTTDGALSGTVNVQIFPEGDNINFLVLTLPLGMDIGCPSNSGAENCLYEDALDVCGGGCAADADQDGVCDDVDDCVGDFDACGVCNGPGAVYDCGCDGQPAGDCDCDGNQEDALGVCGGDCAADADQDGICDDEDGCVGVVDECGICNGPGATADCGCDDLPDGACDCDGNELDALGDCGGDCTADTDQDGVCDDVDDCIGEIDACGICNGPGAVYDCGCDEQPAGDCDCDGNQLDALGICGGDCPADADANGICDDVEGSGCADPDACNFDQYADPPAEEPLTDYCMITEAVTSHTTGELAGMTTYRIYIQTLHPADFVTSVSGNSVTPMDISTSTTFYQDALGGATSENVNPLLIPGFPNLAFDSWVTIGLDGPANATAEESAATIVNSPNQNWALQFEPGFGAPGGNIEIDDEVGGVWYILNGDANGFPDADGRVLLGQFTTDGALSGSVNVQVFPEGDNVNFQLLTLPIGMGVGCPSNSDDENCLYEDVLDVCGGDCAADVDQDGVCDDVDDCIGALDDCGICNGPGAIYDCGCDEQPAGDCDCDGNQLDALGVCGGDCAVDADQDGVCDDVDDCIGNFDACGICNGPGAIYDCGCDEQPAGDCDCDGNQLDALGVCGGDCTADADADGVCDDVDDCIGALDDCGICNGPGAIYDCGCDEQPAGDCDCDGNQLDALGVCGGDCTADADSDGICDDVDDCVGDLDACGVCNGPGAIYDCICEEQPAGDCDCEGNQLDALGICGGDCPADIDGDGVCDNEEVPGCTLETACNFDPLATDDDGSCQVLDAIGECGGDCPTDLNGDGICDTDNVFGCTEPSACNYNAQADVNNGSCDFFSCLGCTDSTADNYDSSATTDDGSCLFSGCTNANASNYDADADIDDGSCLIEGCTDNTACNYSAQANDDDGTCDFSCYGCINSTACNYDADATVNDGNCEFISCRGCTNADAVNYDAGATIDDNSCLFDGCTDPEAENFDADADISDGSCIFPGCNDGAACNYNPQANQDDGSCDFSCYGCINSTACNYDAAATVDDGTCEFDTCRGCTDEDAVNYDSSALIDDSSCLYEGCNDPAASNYDAEADLNDGSCEFLGCTDAAACNYDFGANVDDGSCDLVTCYGCLNALACNYDALATIPSGDCDLLSCRGCTDPGAINYDEDATIDNNSCLFTGCIDPAADNYDETATYSDGSCVYLGCTNQFACNFDIDATVDDGNCDLTSCQGCINALACNYDSTATISDGSCDLFSCRGCTDEDAVNYDAGATIDNGSCVVVGCQDTNADNYNPDATYSDASLCVYSAIEGCIILQACNYNPDATVSDSSCDFDCYGCTDPSANNYNAESTLDDGSCTFGMVTGNMALMTGCSLPFACNFGDQVNPCEFDSCAGCLEEGSCNYDPDATLATSCFDAEDLCNGATNVDCDCNCLNDSNENGICDEDETGGCTEPLSCNYDASASFDDGSCETESCSGCTDSSACNYDETALLNDNSCDYNSCAGCLDSSACNYSASATVDDGSCNYAPEYVDCSGDCLNDANENDICDELEEEGCTDPFACNFNSNATIDNGSCENTSCAGCTDDIACNYDAEAVINDGSCDYDSCVGCTDGTACNYDAGATINSGACIYPDSGFVDCNGECLEDANENGVCDPLEVQGCTDSGACNYNANANVDDGSCDLTGCLGCLDPTACNYDAEATQPDGSCDYTSCLGCTDEEACNYDNAATQDDGNCTYAPGLLLDCGGECINDADGDGVCDELEEPGCEDADACNYSATATDGDGTCEYDSCLGCLDAAACNYNATATQSDGSCEFEACVGCMAPNACNYDPNATQGDASCTYPAGLLLDCAGNCVNDTDADGVCDELEVMGCDDEGACNFNALATENDSSCDFDTCKGCTVPSACNYNPAATQNDGSCDLSSCLGCTYEDALNYDASATNDNGSCLFDNSGDGDTCPGDFTDDGIIGIADLLEFLVVFDSACAE